MNAFLSFLILSGPSAWAAVHSWESELAKPMAARLRSFKQSPKVSYRFLSRTAFDQKQNLQMRWRALTTMGRVDARYFQADLEKAVQSHEWFIRNAALIALLNAPREVALRWSMSLLQDPSLMVRTQAVRNLVGLDAREAEPLLWKTLWDAKNFRRRESLWIRAHVAEALARMARPGQARVFQRLLMDPDVRLHPWAVLGLEKSTGIKLGSSKEPIEIRRAKWLSRLGVETI